MHSVVRVNRRIPSIPVLLFFVAGLVACFGGGYAVGSGQARSASEGARIE